VASCTLTNWRSPHLWIRVLYVYPAKLGLLNVAIGKLARLTVFNKVHIQALQIPSTMLSHEVASTENGLAKPDRIGIYQSDILREFRCG